tara:strand:+ start:242 stop:361 length:120 start_codon:yes stop_codon:yes gene_type:complete
VADFKAIYSKINQLLGQVKALNLALFLPLYIQNVSLCYF